MEESVSKNVLSGFANYLAEHNLLDKQSALNALQQANQAKQSYIEYLIQQKLLEESQVARSTAEYFGLPLCCLLYTSPSPRDS